jgi:hypothetical protein
VRFRSVLKKIETDEAPQISANGPSDCINELPDGRNSPPAGLSQVVAQVVADFGSK